MNTSSSVILVVEDAAHVLQLITASLAGASVHLVTATDGAQGLELAQELGPDLVLLDIALPGMDGFEVLRDLRGNPKTAAVPVVIITAHGDSATASRARTEGADYFIAKPFRPAELRRVIDQFLPSAGSVAS